MLIIRKAIHTYTHIEGVFNYSCICKGCMNEITLTIFLKSNLIEEVENILKSVHPTVV